MSDNLLISAVQAAFDEAVQKAVAVHLGPLRAKLDAVEAAVSLVRTQAELIPSPELDYDSLAARIDLAELAQHVDLESAAVNIDLSKLAEQVSLADLAGELTHSQLETIAEEIDLNDLAGKLNLSDLTGELDGALSDWFQNQSFTIKP